MRADRIRWSIVGLAACAALVSARAASAQTTPVADVAVGYSFLTDGDTSFPVGIFFDVGASVSQNLQFVGEVARHATTENVFGVDVDLRETSFLVGPRIVTRGNGVASYFQALVGGASVSGGTDVFGIGVGVSTTAFAVQLGAGAVVPVSDRVGVRIGGDYQFIDADEFGSNSQFKVSAGVSFALGER